MGATRADVSLPLEATDDFTHRSPRYAVALAKDHLVQVLVGIQLHRQDLPFQIFVETVFAALHRDLL